MRACSCAWRYATFCIFFLFLFVPKCQNDFFNPWAGKVQSSYHFFPLFFFCRFQYPKSSSHKCFWRNLELGFISFQGFLLQNVIWFDDPQHHGRTWACHLKSLALTSLIHIPQIMYPRSLDLPFFFSSDMVPNIMFKELKSPRPTYAGLEECKHPHLIDIHCLPITNRSSKRGANFYLKKLCLFQALEPKSTSHYLDPWIQDC